MDNFKKHILMTTLIAGTMDISAAFIQSYVLRDVMPSTVLRYIASGIFGTNAYSGGAGIMIFGLLVHFLIVFSCTVCFFWLYPKWQFLKKSVFLNGVLIALTAWVVTAQIIVPLSKIQRGGFNLTNALIAIAILIVCIGLPIAYGAKHYFGS